MVSLTAVCLSQYHTWVGWSKPAVTVGMSTQPKIQYYTQGNNTFNPGEINTSYKVCGLSIHIHISVGITLLTRNCIRRVCMISLLDCFLTVKITSHSVCGTESRFVLNTWADDNLSTVQAPRWTSQSASHCNSTGLPTPKPTLPILSLNVPQRANCKLLPI